MSWFLVQCGLSAYGDVVCGLECGQREAGGVLAYRENSELSDAQVRACLSCPEGLPVAVIAPQRGQEGWKKKALTLAHEGLLVGVFLELEAAQQWVLTKARTARIQVVFEQNQ